MNRINGIITGYDNCSSLQKKNPNVPRDIIKLVCKIEKLNHIINAQKYINMMNLMSRSLLLSVGFITWSKFIIN